MEVGWAISASYAIRAHAGQASVRVLEREDWTRAARGLGGVSDALVARLAIPSTMGVGPGEVDIRTTTDICGAERR